MSVIHYNKVIIELGHQMQRIAHAYSSGGFESIASQLRTPLGALCVLYITLKGFALLFGYIKEPMNEFVKSAIKIGAIYTIALDWGVFSHYFVELISVTSNELGQALLHLNPIGSDDIRRLDIISGLQMVLNEIIWMGNWTWQQGSFTSSGPFFTAIVIFFSGCCVVGLAFFEIVVSKMILTILFCVAPLFIIFKLFDQTQSYFNSWIDKCVSNGLIIIFVSAVVGSTLALVHWSIPITAGRQVIESHLVGWVPIAFCSFLSIKFIREAVALAKSIGGYCGTSEGSAMVGALAGSAMGLGLNGLTKGKNVMSKARNYAKTRPLKKAMEKAQRLPIYY